MSDFLFRMPFAIIGAFIGIKRGGFIRMFIYSFIGSCVGDLLLMLLTR